MRPRELKRWAGQLATLRAMRAAIAAVHERDGQQVRARLALVDSSIEDNAARLERDAHHDLTQGDAS